jgi:hypothetical protein
MKNYQFIAAQQHKRASAHCRNLGARTAKYFFKAFYAGTDSGTEDDPY